MTIIAAVADNLAIGVAGDLAFHISADLKRFKELTMGKTIVMGRKTFESLPKGALPGRRNIVITRNSEWTAPNVVTAQSLQEALDASQGEVFVIGGGQIYRQAIPFADTLQITRIFAPVPEADTFFPEYDSEWEICHSYDVETDPKSGLNYQFQILNRKQK